ncbi:glycosyltransferase family 15 protein [Rhodotorula paludigena]|uniref:glycosyltransferase family 15 protein n=1 Tax=Rhodotorula paludigena TaxID=86838 RepID=UPI0031784748
MISASPYVRYGLALVGALFFLHLVGQLISDRYAHHTSLDSAKVRLGLKERPAEMWAAGHKLYPWEAPQSEMFEDEEGFNATQAQEDKVKATFVMLARNSDVWGAVESIRGLEDRFNRRHHHDWTFLNEEPFSDEFKRHTSGVASGKTRYGLIPKDDWLDGFPSWVNETRARAAISEMGKQPIPYGGSIPYRHMCRYQSGKFFRHELLKGYEYYWRVEPDVKFYCDIVEDPFVTMKRLDKSYGFVVSLYEYQATIPTLWQTTKDFIEANPEYVAKPNLMEWISNDGGKTYNGCHFWSNFEIARLDFWQGPAYSKYFEHLDKAGGFFYERWGDAPVHSLAAALFLHPNQTHFFSNIGYFHNPFAHCPLPGNGVKCACSTSTQDPPTGPAFETHGYSCTPKWKKLTGYKGGTPFAAQG